MYRCALARKRTRVYVHTRVRKSHDDSERVAFTVCGANRSRRATYSSLCVNKSYMHAHRYSNCNGCLADTLAPGTLTCCEDSVAGDTSFWTSEFLLIRYFVWWVYGTFNSKNINILYTQQKIIMIKIISARSKLRSMIVCYRNLISGVYEPFFEIE